MNRNIQILIKFFWSFTFVVVLFCQPVHAEVLVTNTDCKDRIFDKTVGYYNESQYPVWYIQEWDKVKYYSEAELENWLEEHKNKVFDKKFWIDSVWEAHIERLECIKSGFN